MNKLFLFVLLLSSVTFSYAQSSNSSNGEWEILFDSEMSNWDQYLSYKHQLGYDGSQPKDASGNLIAPVGLNPKGYDVFVMKQDENENILHVSGEYYGCVVTKKEYTNYHFSIQFKWGEKVYDPRKNLLKDSGILYHSIGPHGAEHWRSWMLSQEFQVMKGHLGDYWSQKNSEIDIKAYTPEYIMSPVADERANFISFGKKQPNEVYCMRSVNHEKEEGEWNTLDLICYEDKSLHIVNGKVVMILKNSKYASDEGSVPLTKGKIQLQSEAAELYYKNAKIKKINQLPTEYLDYYK